jgi:hypothetical protein
MPVADKDYKKKLEKATAEGRGQGRVRIPLELDPRLQGAVMGGTSGVGVTAGKAIQGVVGSILGKVAGFGSKAPAVVPKVTSAAPRALPSGRNLPAVRNLPATRRGVGRPAPNNSFAKEAGVIAGGAVVAGGTAKATSAYRAGRNSATTPSVKPSVKPAASSSTKRKDLAFFMAEAKKKGKTGKAVSNYAYTMLKDSRMRTGTTALTGDRISGTKKV